VGDDDATSERDSVAPLTGIRISRDTLLFLGGLAGAAHETLAAATERPTLLILFAGMMGLPAFLRADERKQEGR
jgi:hypothetical protein